MFRATYKPYNSDSESDSDSESSYTTDTSSDTTSTSSTSTSSAEESVKEGFQGPDYTALATALAEPKIGSSTNTTGGYATFSNYTIPPDASGSLLTSSSQQVTSIIMIDSANRDKNLFINPTNLTLRLPRIYKKVVNFQILQIKLLSAFYYFSVAKQNIYITIQELGRIPIQTTIREGTYDINSLLAEINTELNNTPIFYDFINGFQDFAQKFAVTGDFSLNFNYPGDYYYDSLLDQYIANPTTAQIVSRYFVQQFAGLSSYTADQIKIAYYYPVLKEVLLDNSYSGTPIDLTLNTSQADLLPGETPYSRVVYTFQGINDPVILELITNNTPSLTEYRLNNTFRYYLINKYNVFYETQTNRIIFSSSSLNTSLVTLLNTKSSQYFAEQLALYGLTIDQYNALSTQNTLLLAVLNDMYNYIQKYLALYFGIPYNTFTAAYLANPTFHIPIRDAYNALNIPQTFNTQALEANVTATTQDVLDTFNQSATPYWNRMTGLTDTIAYLNPILSGDVGGKGLPLPTWSAGLDAQDPANPIVKANVTDPDNPNPTPVGFLYSNKRTATADYIAPIEAAEYTVFRFKSPVRQTIRLTTLPRPTKYRYPAYNAITYDASNVALFDNSYCFVSNAANQNMDISSVSLLQIPGFSTLNATSFGKSYTSSLAFWGGSTNTLSVVQSRQFYEFYSPVPPGAPAAPAYTYPLRLTLAHSPDTNTFAAPLYLFLYQDRGAFMADISGNRNEQPIHYLQVVSTTTSQSTVNINFTAYANKKYYLIARSQDLSFPTETYQIVPNFPAGSAYTTLTNSLAGFNPTADPTANLTNFNYAQNADPAFIRLPIQSSLMTGPQTDVALSTLSFSTPLMGYDISGVSTDLTNYIGYDPNIVGSNADPLSQIRIDPTNGFIFQAKSPYNVSTQTYLDNTSNSILYPNASGLYTNTTIPFRQASIVHWYGTHFIPPTENQVLFPPNNIAYTTIIPFTHASPLPDPIPGYIYDDRLDASGNLYLNTSDFLNLGDGVMGICFIPDQGTWDIDRFMFKSVFTSATADPNLGISHIGIFPAILTSNQPIESLQLSNAAAVLSFTSSITYNSSNLNFGFDVAGGTYYEYTRDTSYLTGSNSYLGGYRQSAYEYNFDLNTYYVAVPFNAAKTITYYFGLVGSAVPYPLYSDTDIVASVTSPEGPLAPPTGKSFVVPSGLLPGGSAGPPAGYTDTQSQYEQSIPITNSLMLYAKPYPINSITGPFDAWSQFPYAPTHLVTDCSGHMLLKDSVFRVFSYPTGVSSQTFQESYQFTLDQVFPPASNINYLGVAASETRFAFFGLSNTTMTIRTMNPITGAIDGTFSEQAPLGFQSSVQILGLTYNNYGGYCMSASAYDSGSGSTTQLVLSRANSSTTQYTTLTLQTPNPAMQKFLIGQSPKEEFGRFWVFPYRTALSGPITEGIQDFAYVNPNQTAQGSPPVATYTAATGPLAGPVTYTAVIPYFLNQNTLTTYKAPIVTRDVAKDRIFFLNAAAPTNFFEAPIVTYQSTVTTISSVYTFPSTPTSFHAGANGAKWALLYDTMFGNRADSVDGPRSAEQAWQIFYPVHRIVFHQISKQNNRLFELSGLQYPEYPHTALAVYDNSGSFAADTEGKWGLENSNNFVSADFKFSGAYFNAYDYDIPVYDNRSTEDYYYISLRNYSPAEKSQVLLRASAPNKYTFGYVTPTDLSGEIATAKYVSTTNDRFQTYYWDPLYIKSILAFDSNFIIGSNGQTFGSGVIPGYNGSNISSVTGFGDFYARFQGVFQTYSTQVQLASTITANVNNSLSNFIKTDLQYIIPSNALNRQRFTDPLRYSILWRSALTPIYAALEDSWGLGWNLGFTKADTPYETIQKSPSFFKLLDDYIFLRMNPEFDMNRMDTTLKENLAATQEPTGTTKSFYGKLLLANFGSYAQTMISNPLTFTPPFGKMDKLTFQWVDNVGAVIANADCEWNAVIQLVETVDIVSLPTPMLINPSPAPL